MQTLTISRTGGRSNYTLSPTRNTGELQDKFAKCNGKSRKSAIRDTRTKRDFPKFEAGMSTADYVKMFEALGTPCKPVEWEQLNEEPCTLYSGADTCETLPAEFESWEDYDAAQCSAAPESTQSAANDDAAPTVPDPEPAAPGAIVAADSGMLSDRERAEFDRVAAEVAPPHYAIGHPLTTQSDSVPVPGKLDATPVRPDYPDVWAAWRDVRNGRADPDAYQGHVIECMELALETGLFYNSQTWPAAAALMFERHHYPDWRDSSADNGVARFFGTDCYNAHDIIRKRAADAADKAAADGFQAGQKFARLIFNDYKLCTGAVLHSLTHTGKECRLTGKRAGRAFEVTCTATTLENAIERAAERAAQIKAKRARAKPAPIADPVPSKSELDPVPLDTQPETISVEDARAGAAIATRNAEAVAQACGGKPTAALLESQAQRISDAAYTMPGLPRISGMYRFAASSLRALAATIATEPDDDETIPAPLDGLDVAELDGLAEFERAGGEVKPTAPAYRDDALCAAPAPCLRIPDTDPRIRIPAQLKPFYSIMQNVGRARHLVNFHDGVSTHKDGSPFSDVRIFRNARARDKFCHDLKAQGYAAR